MDDVEEFSQILLSKKDRVATITLNRPAKLNATTRTMKAELVRALGQIRVSKDVSVVVLEGSGRAFSAGHDLTEKVETPPIAVADEWFHEQEQVFETLRMYRHGFWDLPQPVIGKIRGHCLTVGLEWAMQCDLVYASEDAKIAWRPVSGAGRYMHMWPWLIGMRKTKELLFTGQYLSGIQAAEYGMVNAAIPDGELDDFVTATATQIAGVPLEYLAIDKQAVNHCFELMGIWSGVEYAATMHAVGHRTRAGLSETERIYANKDWRAGVAYRDQRYRDS